MLYISLHMILALMFLIVIVYSERYKKLVNVCGCHTGVTQGYKVEFFLVIMTSNFQNNHIKSYLDIR